LEHLKDETNKTYAYETGYLSTMALSSFLNFSSPPSYRTGLVLLVELIRLAGDKTSSIRRRRREVQKRRQCHGR
jgi:hypothetical protein